MDLHICLVIMMVRPSPGLEEVTQRWGRMPCLALVGQDGKSLAGSRAPPQSTCDHLSLVLPAADLPVEPEGQRPDRHGFHRHPALHPPDDQRQELHPGGRCDEKHFPAPLPRRKQDPLPRQPGIERVEWRCYQNLGDQGGMPESCPQFTDPPLLLQDAKPLEVYSVDFMVDSTQLGFLGV